MMSLRCLNVSLGWGNLNVQICARRTVVLAGGRDLMASAKGAGTSPRRCETGGDPLSVH